MAYFSHRTTEAIHATVPIPTVTSAQPHYLNFRLDTFHFALNARFYVRQR